VPASDPTRKPKKIIKKVAGIDPKLRADHGKAHVIISEKKDKKAAKYLTKDLPYPYTSKAQFEKSMEIPVGMEWNTRVGFQRQTLPRVVKKVCAGWRAVFRLLTPYVGQMGTVIDPLEKLFLVDCGFISYYCSHTTDHTWTEICFADLSNTARLKLTILRRASLPLGSRTEHVLM
jgi:Utp14 protein